jgi:hypothetical protein
MPKVTFDIMQDIPEDKRGLHYWANPNWLCLAKRRVQEYKTYAYNDNTMRENRNNSKPISIMDSEGEIHHFKSRGKAVLWIGYRDVNSVGLFNAIKKGEVMENGDVRIVCFGKEYVVIKE